MMKRRKDPWVLTVAGNGKFKKMMDLMSVSEKRFVTDGVGFPGG
jgi:hypothetical protein